MDLHARMTWVLVTLGATLVMLLLLVVWAVDARIVVSVAVMGIAGATAVQAWAALYAPVPFRWAPLADPRETARIESTELDGRAS